MLDLHSSSGYNSLFACDNKTLQASNSLAVYLETLRLPASYHERTRLLSEKNVYLRSITLQDQIRQQLLQNFAIEDFDDYKKRLQSIDFSQYSRAQLFTWRDILHTYQHYLANFEGKKYDEYRFELYEIREKLATTLAHLFRISNMEDFQYYLQLLDWRTFEDVSVDRQEFFIEDIGNITEALIAEKKYKNHVSEKIYLLRKLFKHSDMFVFQQLEKEFVFQQFQKKLKLILEDLGISMTEESSNNIGNDSGDTTDKHGLK